jgi:hypothetical protein
VTSSTPTALQEYVAAAATVAALPTDVAGLRDLPEAALLDLVRLAADLSRSAGTQMALLAGEVARRSSPALGSAGLAQRTGHRTPEQLVKIIAGVSGRDAARAARLGRLIHDTVLSGTADPSTGEVIDNAQPWLRPVAGALQSGTISLDAADAIRVGLGIPNSAVTTAQLEAAAGQLSREAEALDPDQLSHRARQLRDELDAEGIPIREMERRAQRSFRVTVLPNGMGRAVWIMDPETLALAKNLCDRVTSPRLGGPRFLREKDASLSKAILADARTTQQLLSDSILELLRLGADADPQFLLGSGSAQIHVTVAKTSSETSDGYGRLEGQPDPVSLATVERLACDGETAEVTFTPDRRPLDVGRRHRHFTPKQRIALAIRDGGCLWPACERPPSWTEAHHTKHWDRDHGNTDIDDGVLLCRHHHLLLHNNGWQINRDDGHVYWLVPPPDVDASQTPIRMPGKSEALNDLFAG